MEPSSVCVTLVILRQGHPEGLSCCSRRGSALGVHTPEVGELGSGEHGAEENHD